MVTFPTVSRALRVRFPHRPQRFTQNFWSDCLSEKIFKVNLQNWKDNGGCLPVLDAGGRKFESCFPDEKWIVNSELKIDEQSELTIHYSY